MQAPVNPCDELAEREAAGLPFDEEAVVRAIREACAYRRNAPAHFFEEGTAVRAAASEDFKAFHVCTLSAAALLVDDVLVAHPALKPESAMKEAANALITVASLLVRAAKALDGGEFEPGRLALAAFDAAAATKRAPLDEVFGEVLTFREPGALRKEFNEAKAAEDKAEGTKQ